jgi:hypothetical protein
MGLKEICVMVISVNSPTGGIVLRQDANAFGFGDVLPAIGELQVIFKKSFQGFHLDGEPMTGLVQGCICFSDRVDNFGMPPEP